MPDHVPVHERNLRAQPLDVEGVDADLVLNGGVPNYVSYTERWRFYAATWPADVAELEARQAELICNKCVGGIAGDLNHCECLGERNREVLANARDVGAVFEDEVWASPVSCCSVCPLQLLWCAHPDDVQRLLLFGYPLDLLLKVFLRRAAGMQPLSFTALSFVWDAGSPHLLRLLDAVRRAGREADFTARFDAVDLLRAVLLLHRGRHGSSSGVHSGSRSKQC